MNPHMEALGFTLVHFCWQAALIAAAYKLSELFWPKLRPQMRYALGLSALLTMFVAALLTFLYEEIRLFQLAATGPSPAAIPLLNINQSLSLSAWLPWLDAVWLIGVLGLTFRMITSLWQVYGLKKQAQSVPIAISDRFNAALRRFGLTGKVQVRLHPAISGPFVVGAFRSVVYLPLSAVTSLSPAQLDAVLSHELEHIRRADYLWNLIQNLIETLFFYHPAVWWMGAKLREQRELCCDDAAISHCEDPITYATALLSLEEQRQERYRGVPGLSMALNGQGRHELLSRISRILGEKPEARLKVRPVAFVLLPAMLLTLTAFAAAPVSEAAGKFCPQKTAQVTSKATLALAQLQEAITGHPASDPSAQTSATEPVKTVVPDDKIEWDNDRDHDDIDPDAIAAEARADAIQARADIAHAKDLDIDPQALAAHARAEAMQAKADLEREGIADNIDPDAIAAKVLADTQHARADVTRLSIASIDPDAIAAQARAAAVAAKAQYAAQKAAQKSEWARQKSRNQMLKDQRFTKPPLPPLPPVAPEPAEVPAPLAAPSQPAAPAPLAEAWTIETRGSPFVAVALAVPKPKSGALALQTLDKLPNARPAPIPSPDASTDVVVQAKTIVHVTVDTRH
jgi:beta-lactamase regulating signal transducer with metallopeptidase domain